MRRYLVFGGHCYYASGGFRDFLGDFDNLKDAEAITNASEEIEWWHIFDLNNKEIVSSHSMAHDADRVSKVFDQNRKLFAAFD
jgi:hypothetical protein